MQGVALIVAFVIAIVVMIVAIAKAGVHPFLAIMGVALVLGLLSPIPLLDVKNGAAVVRPGLATVIGSGFSSTFTSIGIVIILGALIGAILDVTQGAVALANAIIKALGPRHPTLAMVIMGWIVSIPVFCDSGFVLLNPIRRALVKRTGAHSVALTVALAGGLYASHVFIPPTPGPIAAANTLGVGDQLILVIALGAVVSLPALAVTYLYARFIGRRVTASDEADTVAPDDTPSVSPGAPEPATWLSFCPIVVPIILMAIGSIVAMAKGQGGLFDVLRFLGVPIVALVIGFLFALALMIQTKTTRQLFDVSDKTLRVVGPILFITAAGGVLGRIIAESGMVAYIKDNATALASFGIVFPFALSAILKSAQGSSTVALVTTAGIVEPLLGTLGLATPLLTVLTVLAIGAGAMTVSHANDSYFWVVTQLGGLKTTQGYKTQTVVTLLEGVASMLLIIALWAIFGG